MRLEITSHRRRVEETVDAEKGLVFSYWESAIGRCSCGALVTLDDPMDNFCDCGRCFNWGGQEVIPLAECQDHDDY